MPKPSFAELLITAYDAHASAKILEGAVSASVAELSAVAATAADGEQQVDLSKSAHAALAEHASSTIDELRDMAVAAVVAAFDHPGASKFFAALKEAHARLEQAEDDANSNGADEDAASPADEGITNGSDEDEDDASPDPVEDVSSEANARQMAARAVMRAARG